MKINPILVFLPFASICLTSCGGALFVKAVPTDITLEVEGNRAGPDLWITRNSAYWDEYSEPCTLDEYTSWCSRSFNTNYFDVQPSHTIYRVFVRNFSDFDRYVKTTVRRKRDDGDYDVYRSTLFLGPRETREAWQLGITFTNIVDGEKNSYKIEPPVKLASAD